MSTGQTTSANAPYQRRSLMSVHFNLSGYADHHVGNVYRSIEKLTNSKKRTFKLWEGTSMPNWDEGMELKVSVLDRAHSKRGTREETG